jgi:glycine oxidase
MRSWDTIVVGGGLIGCAAARALAGEGQKVLVLERDALGRGASWAAAGMLAPQAEIEEGGPFLDLCLESRRLHATLAEELRVEVGAEVHYRGEGTFMVAFGDEERLRLERVAAAQRALGLPAEILDGATARAAEPALTHAVSAVLAVEGDHQIDNRRLMAAMIASCRTRGVELREGTPARALLRGPGGQVTGVLVGDEKLGAGTVVVAAGCWSGALEGIALPVEPVKGQMVALQVPKAAFARVLRSERCYLVPREAGRLLVGATMEHAGFDRSVSEEHTHALVEAASVTVPALRKASIVEVWTGLRPGTADGLPAVGWLEENLVAATGHFRNGILLAPITARIVADLVAGRPSHGSLPLLDPRRFSPAGLRA